MSGVTGAGSRNRALAPGSGGENDLGFPEISPVAVLGSCVAWTVGGLGVVAWRYSRLVIAR